MSCWTPYTCFYLLNLSLTNPPLHFTSPRLLTPLLSCTGKTIPYLNKDTKTYGKRPDHVQVKIEPREVSSNAFAFDDTDDEHTSKRQCVAPS